MVIPKDAPHPDNAHAFIDFMQRPEIAARNSDYVNYANGNKDSQPKLSKEVIEDPGDLSGDAVMQRSSRRRRTIRGAARDHALWTNLKTGS